MGTPFKMKGSPMQRNYGIGGSPVKQTPTDADLNKVAKLEKDAGKDRGAELALKYYRTKHLTDAEKKELDAINAAKKKESSKTETTTTP